MAKESDFKTQLVLEICSISSRSLGCVHRHAWNPEEPPFIDWYCVLGVEESSGIDVIRKRYHELALQLHPDKNKHSKSEIAFKLVSEAYKCLSDNTRRNDLDLKRLKNFCLQCNRIPYTSCSNGSSNASSKLKAWNPAHWSRYYKSRRSLDDTKERFKEEARVIKNCLQANATARTESLWYNRKENYLQRSMSQHRTERETPVFNPADYLFQGYPHRRTRNFNKPEKFWYLQTESTMIDEVRGGTYDSPIFEVREGRRLSTSMSSFVRS